MLLNIEMSDRYGEGRYIPVWSGEARRWRKRATEDIRTPPPLTKVSTETLQAVKRTLDYPLNLLLNLKYVQKNIEKADEIFLILEKGEESKRKLQPNTTRVSLKLIRDEEGKIIRDQDGNITEKVLTIGRGDKYCQFIFSNTSGEEKMSIGKTNLNDGYEKAIKGWTATGVDVLSKAIEDHYTPTAKIDFINSDTST